MGARTFRSARRGESAQDRTGHRAPGAHPVQRAIAGSVLAVAVTVLVLGLWHPAHRVWLTWTLEHGDPADQIEAALTLGKLESVEAIPALLGRLETAIALLSTEGDAEEPYLRKHLSSLCSRAEASVLQLVKLPASRGIVESLLATARSGTALRLLEACRRTLGRSPRLLDAYSVAVKRGLGNLARGIEGELYSFGSAAVPLLLLLDEQADPAAPGPDRGLKTAMDVISDLGPLGLLASSRIKEGSSGASVLPRIRLLREIDVDPLPFVLDALSGGELDPTDRRKALEFLEDHPIPAFRIWPSIVPHLLDEEPLVRAAALRLLFKVRPGAFSDLREALNLLHGQDLSAAEEAMESLRTTDSLTAIPMLALALLCGSPPSVRWKLLDCLAYQCGMLQAMSEFSEGREAPEDEARADAAMPPEVAWSLEDLQKSIGGSGPVPRLDAIRALARLGAHASSALPALFKRLEMNPNQFRDQLKGEIASAIVRIHCNNSRCTRAFDPSASVRFRRVLSSALAFDPGLIQLALPHVELLISQEFEVAEVRAQELDLSRSLQRAPGGDSDPEASGLNWLSLSECRPAAESVDFGMIVSLARAGESGLGVLGEILQHTATVPDLDLELPALHAAALLGPAAAPLVGHLSRRLESADVGLSILAGCALEQVGAAAVPDLRRALWSERVDTRALSAWVLGRIRSSEVVGAVRDLGRLAADDPSELVRAHAALALERIACR